MRILLVTNKSDHHKYWVTELCSKFNVVGICHPQPERRRTTLISRLRERGVVLTILKLMSAGYHRISSRSFSKTLQKLQPEFFGKASETYDKLPSGLIYAVNGVNSSESIAKARTLAPDVICFLGGDIAQKEFLDVAKIATLNYHSGVSPFYNGSGTTFAAVADGRPNFCGGTLMVMNERIDGGDILGHYLTPIREEDTASSLFLKGIFGAVKLYMLALDRIKETQVRPKGFAQKRSFRYFTSSDWTIYHDMKLQYFERSGKMKSYRRDEKLFNYSEWDKNLGYPPYFNVLSEILKK